MQTNFEGLSAQLLEVIKGSLVLDSGEVPVGFFHDSSLISQQEIDRKNIWRDHYMLFEEFCSRIHKRAQQEEKNKANEIFLALDKEFENFETDFVKNIRRVREECMIKAKDLTNFASTFLEDYSDGALNDNRQLNERLEKTAKCLMHVKDTFSNYAEEAKNALKSMKEAFDTQFHLLNLRYEGVPEKRHCDKAPILSKKRAAKEVLEYESCKVGLGISINPASESENSSQTLLTITKHGDIICLSEDGNSRKFNTVFKKHLGKMNPSEFNSVQFNGSGDSFFTLIINQKKLCLFSAQGTNGKMVNFPKEAPQRATWLTNNSIAVAFNSKVSRFSRDSLEEETSFLIPKTSPKRDVTAIVPCENEYEFILGFSQGDILRASFLEKKLELRYRTIYSCIHSITRAENANLICVSAASTTAILNAQTLELVHALKTTIPLNASHISPNGDFVIGLSDKELFLFNGFSGSKVLCLGSKELKTGYSDFYDLAVSWKKKKVFFSTATVLFEFKFN